MVKLLVFMSNKKEQATIDNLYTQNSLLFTEKNVSFQHLRLCVRFFCRDMLAAVCISSWTKEKFNPFPIVYNIYNNKK